MLQWLFIEERDGNFDIKIPVPVFYKDEPTDLICKQHVEYIMSNYPPPYHLMLSGGIDSQAMLWCWHKYGANYIPTTIIYNNNLNWHDVEFLFKYADCIGEKVSAYNLDVLGFYRGGEYEQFVDKYRCGSPHICVHMKMTDAIPENGTIIYSGDPLLNNTFVERNNWGLFKFAKKQKRPVIPFFFLETAKMATNFLANPTVIKPLSKEQYYRDYIGAPIISQENQPPFFRPKYTGFELIKDYYDLHFAHLVTGEDRKLKKTGQRSERVYDLLLRNKHEYRFRNDTLTYRFIRGNNDAKQT